MRITLGVAVRSRAHPDSLEQLFGMKSNPAWGPWLLVDSRFWSHLFNPLGLIFCLTGFQRLFLPNKVRSMCLLTVFGVILTIVTLKTQKWKGQLCSQRTSLPSFENSSPTPLDSMSRCHEGASHSCEWMSNWAKAILKMSLFYQIHQKLVLKTRN